MFQKEERVGLIVYLYYNRDVKKLAAFGDVIYHSKKRRYLQLYVPKRASREPTKKFGTKKICQEGSSLSHSRIG